MGAPLQEVTNHGTPPCSKGGHKQAHSPWSAPRERRKRTKPQEVAPLTSIEEADFASPPKRRNGVMGQGGREGREPFKQGS